MKRFQQTNSSTINSFNANSTCKFEIYFPTIIACNNFKLTKSANYTFHETTFHCRGKKRIVHHNSIDLMSIHKFNQCRASTEVITFCIVKSRNKDEKVHENLYIIYSTVVTLRSLIRVRRRMLRGIKCAA